MTKSGKSKYPAAARVGINPTTTLAECCKRFDNPLIAKVLHSAAVGMGFIPVLPTADKIKSKCTAAAMMGINPSPTLGKCDQCMNMYAKQTSRMISPSGSGACAGKGFMPFLKQCSTFFSKWLKHFQRLGHFLREGIKPFPALGMVINNLSSN